MFYTQLKKICNERGEILTVLVKKLGFSSGNMHKWAKGGNPSGKTLLTFANYFNVSVDYFLKDDNSVPSPENEQDVSIFYDQLVKICNLRGTTPTNVMRKIGLSKSNLQRWKHGASIRNETLKTIAEYFGVPIEYFFSSQNLCVMQKNAHSDFNTMFNHEMTTYQQKVFDLFLSNIDRELKGEAHIPLKRYMGFVGIKTINIHNIENDIKSLYNIIITDILSNELNCFPLYKSIKISYDENNNGELKIAAHEQAIPLIKEYIQDFPIKIPTTLKE